MITTVGILAGLLALAPQGGGQQRAIGVDENGWPIFESTESAKPGTPPVTSSAETANKPPPAAPRGESVTLEKPTTELARGRANDNPLGLDSPLRDVFRRVGQPADLQDLGGVIAWYQFIVRDHRGGELINREVTHEADMRFPDRDRLLLPGRKIYGRDGRAVYAELHRLPMPSYEEEAAEELELFGLLLRAPWSFADDGRFRIQPQSHITVGNQRLLRIEVERVPPENAKADAPQDRFEILCDPHSMDPVEIRYTLASTRATRRIQLTQYQRVGGVRIPMRRVVTDELGNPSLEWSILRFDSKQQFPRSQFRPVTR